MMEFLFFVLLQAIVGAVAGFFLLKKLFSVFDVSSYDQPNWSPIVASLVGSFIGYWLVPVYILVHIYEIELSKMYLKYKGKF